MKTARLNKSPAGLLLTYWCPVSQALTLYLLLIEHSSRGRDLERPAQTLAGQPPFTVRLLLIPRRESGLTRSRWRRAALSPLGPPAPLNGVYPP